MFRDSSAGEAGVLTNACGPSATLEGPPPSLEQRLRRNRNTRRAARIATVRDAGLWIAACAALVAIGTVSQLTAR